MTYNTAKRRRFTKRQRAVFLDKHHHMCHWCKQRIEEGEPWAVEHIVPRELMPDNTADADDNLAPIHAHPKPCHKEKTRLDIKMISKSNRVRRQIGPVELRKKPKHPLKGRPFQKGHRPMNRRTK